MKVLLLGRPGLFENMGGDRVQIEQTAENLRKLGVDVAIETGIDADFKSYDMVHVFQLDWNPDCFFQIKNAKKSNKPVVFSPIHHKLEELKRFDDEYVFDFRRISKVLFKNQFNRDLFKEFYRSLFKPSRLWLVLYCAIYGLKKMYCESISNSDVILVQTTKEAEDLKRTFGIDFKWKIVKNGVGDVYLNADLGAKNPMPFDNYLLCVGRVEPRKNQLSIIEAVKNLREETKLDLKLVFIGANPSKKHFEYTSLFEKALKHNDWISHVSRVNYEQMPLYYRFAKVGISASWFETTGLTSLEAIFCHANAVASGERAKEYLGEYAFYCDPGNVQSIKEAIKMAYTAPRPQITDQMRTEYTWQNAAKQTFEVYNELV